MSGLNDQPAVPRYTPEHYRNTVEGLGLTLETAARVLGVNERTSRRYASDTPPPAMAIRLLELLDGWTPAEVDDLIAEYEAAETLRARARVGARVRRRRRAA